MWTVPRHKASNIDIFNSNSKKLWQKKKKKVEEKWHASPWMPDSYQGNETPQMKERSIFLRTLNIWALLLWQEMTSHRFLPSFRMEVGHRKLLAELKYVLTVSKTFHRLYYHTPSSSWASNFASSSTTLLLPLSLEQRSKNEWSYTSTPQYAYMAWWLVKHRDNFTFTFTLGTCDSPMGVEFKPVILISIKFFLLKVHNLSYYRIYFCHFLLRMSNM